MFARVGRNVLFSERVNVFTTNVTDIELCDRGVFKLDIFVFEFLEIKLVFFPIYAGSKNEQHCDLKYSPNCHK